MGSARDTLTRPLAIGITTLGLAGLLLTAAPTLLLGVGGAASSVPPTRSMPMPARVPAAGRSNARRMRGQRARRTDQVTSAASAEGPSPTLRCPSGSSLVGGGLFAVRRVAAHGRPMR